ncbi:MAG: heat-inducible transcription repressor HrcA [Acidobacteria bacterium]|nr:heat-inducible transcription repressor HrcA [Acidobacteriota bacterium]
MTKDLTQRSAAVLDVVVRHFIASGQPAGSATVAGLLAEKVSSATVRNVMAQLARQGYLTQSHTSAGRTPTARGYVAYVQHLMRHGDLQRVDERRIRERLDEAQPELDALLQRACSVLSEMTQHVGVVLVPPPAEAAIRHVELVRLGRDRVSIVFMTSVGMVHTRTIIFEEELGERVLDAAADYLRRRFAGQTLRQLRESIGVSSTSASSHPEAIALRLVRRLLGDAIDQSAMYVEGTFHLLDSPELAERATFPDIFAAFEERSELSRVLAECGTETDARVLIGRAGLPTFLGGCALVAAGYRAGTRPGGVLGVLGPARMHYERTIPMVTTMARVTSDMVTRLCA